MKEDEETCKDAPPAYDPATLSDQPYESVKAAKDLLAGEAHAQLDLNFEMHVRAIVGTAQLCLRCCRSRLDSHHHVARGIKSASIENQRPVSYAIEFVLARLSRTCTYYPRVMTPVPSHGWIVRNGYSFEGNDSGSALGCAG